MSGSTRRSSFARPLSGTALILDAYNLLNNNAVSNFNITNGTQYNRIIATLDPRTVQLGFRFEF